MNRLPEGPLRITITIEVEGHGVARRIPVELDEYTLNLLVLRGPGSADVAELCQKAVDGQVDLASDIRDAAWELAEGRDLCSVKPLLPTPRNGLEVGDLVRFADDREGYVWATVTGPVEDPRTGPDGRPARWVVPTDRGPREVAPSDALVREHRPTAPVQPPAPEQAPPAGPCEMRMMRNFGGGPKFLGVRCACGWQRRENGIRTRTAEAAWRRHVRERAEADAQAGRSVGGPIPWTKANGYRGPLPD